VQSSTPVSVRCLWHRSFSSLGLEKGEIVVAPRSQVTFVLQSSDPDFVSDSVEFLVVYTSRGNSMELKDIAASAKDSLTFCSRPVPPFSRRDSSRFTPVR